MCFCTLMKEYASEQDNDVDVDKRAYRGSRKRKAASKRSRRSCLPFMLELVAVDHQSSTLR